MPENSDNGGAVGLSASTSVVVQDPNDRIALPGTPEFLGISAKAIVDRDGGVRVTLTAFASYEDRTVSVGEDIDLETTEIDELLQALIAKHRTRLGRRAMRAAGQAWEIAVRNGEMES